jgi:hypothetical protein
MTTTKKISHKAQKLLGENGADRFRDFSNLRDGWDGGSGKPLSPSSMANFELFVNRFADLVPTEPSLFVSDEGHLVLGWEDKDGGRLEVEFAEGTFEFFRETTNTGGVIEIGRLDELGRRLFGPDYAGGAVGDDPRPERPEVTAAVITAKQILSKLKGGR